MSSFNVIKPQPNCLSSRLHPKRHRTASNKGEPFCFPERLHKLKISRILCWCYGVFSLAHSDNNHCLTIAHKSGMSNERAFNDWGFYLTVSIVFWAIERQPPKRRICIGCPLNRGTSRFRTTFFFLVSAFGVLFGITTGCLFVNWHSSGRLGLVAAFIVVWCFHTFLVLVVY